MKQSMKNHNIRAKQHGATLFIALIFLLILTTLAVTGMREVALDSRITGNLIDHKRLFNATEAGMKDGEHRTIGTLVPIPGKYKFDTALTPVNATDSCANDGYASPCVLDIPPEYPQEFDSGRMKDYSPDNSTSFEEDIHWYAIPAPSGTTQGESENPEYGNMALGIGTFRYEINSRASSEAGELRLRSTVSRVYN